MWVQKIGNHAVKVLAYAPDGRTLYVMDRAGQVAAWDVAKRTRRALFRLTGNDVPNTFAMAATGDGRHVLLWTNELQVWGVSGAPGRVPLPPDFGWQEAQLHPDRRHLVTQTDHALATWDVAARRPGPVLARLKRGTWPGMLAVAPDGRVFTVEQVEQRDQTWLVAGKDRWRLDDLQGFAARMHFTADGRTLVFSGLGTDSLILWDVPSQTTRTEARCRPFRDGPVIHPTAPVMAGWSRDWTLKLLNLDTGEPIRTLDFDIGRYTECAAFSPDGLRCAVGGSNKQFAVFDLDL